MLPGSSTSAAGSSPGRAAATCARRSVNRPDIMTVLCSLSALGVMGFYVWVSENPADAALPGRTRLLLKVWCGFGETHDEAGWKTNKPRQAATPGLRA